MLSSGLGIVGFSWASSPACTELETIIMNWIGKMSGLPESLLPFKKKKEMKENDSKNNLKDVTSLKSFEDFNNNLSDTESETEFDHIVNDIADNSLCEHSRTSGGVLLVKF
jgi:hypothetical protein